MDNELQLNLNPGWQRWVRRALFPVFAVLFFAMLPSLWSLATGYAFNWRTLRLETTAVLVLETSPAGAAIELNGKRLEQRTPANFERLRPGRYHIRLLLPGYYAWSRTVSLRGGEARNLASTLLIPSNPLVTQLLDEAITDFWMEKDGTVNVRLAEDGALQQHRTYGAEAFLSSPMLPSLQGTNREKLAPKGGALLRWEADRVWIVGFDEEPWRSWSMALRETELYRGGARVLNSFWHKDGRNVVIVTINSVLSVSIDDGLVSSPAKIYELSRPLSLCYYDATRGRLFFAESVKTGIRNEWIAKRLDLLTASPSPNGASHDVL